MPNKKSVDYARLQVEYENIIVKKLSEQLGLKSAMELPRVEKITLNMGVGEAVADKKVIDHAVKDMTLIAGQKPIITLSRKSTQGLKSGIICQLALKLP